MEWVSKPTYHVNPFQLKTVPTMAKSISFTSFFHRKFHHLFGACLAFSVLNRSLPKGVKDEPSMVIFHHEKKGFYHGITIEKLGFEAIEDLESVGETTNKMGNS